MEREKMIEEILYKFCERHGIEDKCYDSGKKCADMSCAIRLIATKIVNKYIPEGSVVLTKEELVKTMESGYVYDTTSGDKINIIEIAREIESKETAKEILSELREFVKNRKHRFDLECNAAEETAKSYNKDEYGKEVFTKILHKKDAAWCECDVIESKIDNLVKKYGIEVDE